MGCKGVYITRACYHDAVFVKIQKKKYFFWWGVGLGGGVNEELKFLGKFTKKDIGVGGRCREGGVTKKNQGGVEGFAKKIRGGGSGGVVTRGGRAGGGGQGGCECNVGGRGCSWVWEM